MTPKAFDATYRPYASDLAGRFGFDPDLFLAQWAVETGWATSWAGAPCNLGNIRAAGGAFAQYATIAEFLNAAEWVLRHGSAVTGVDGGDYAGVRATAGRSVDVEMLALGASPWDAGRYNDGGGPGSQLITYWEFLRMATLDDIDTKVTEMIDLRQALLTGAGTPNPASAYAPLFEAKIRAIVEQELATIKGELDAIKTAVAALSQPTVTIPTQITLTGSLHS